MNFAKFYYDRLNKSMELKITNINKDGLDLEGVELVAISPLNLQEYAIIDTTYDANSSISNIQRHFLQLPSIEVVSQDRIYLWTKKGEYSFEQKQGFGVHHIYMNYGSEIWNNDVDKATLIKVGGTQVFAI